MSYFPLIKVIYFGHKSDVTCHIKGFMMLIDLITGDTNFGHLNKLVTVRFPRCKVINFHFGTKKGRYFENIQISSISS